MVWIVEEEVEVLRSILEGGSPELGDPECVRDPGVEPEGGVSVLDSFQGVAVLSISGGPFIYYVSIFSGFFYPSSLFIKKHSIESNQKLQFFDPLSPV